MTVLAFVDDLMDRSRVSAAVPGAAFARQVAPDPGVTVVFVDLARYQATIPEIIATYPDAHVVAFGSHVARDAFDAARTAGVEVVVARSEFFRDPASYTSGHGYER